MKHQHFTSRRKTSHERSPLSLTNMWRYSMLAMMLISLLAPAIADAQCNTWTPMGGAGITTSSIDYPSMALDASGNAYVAYRDAANSNKATVRMWGGGSWTQVGNVGFSADVANYTSIAIDNFGIVYVAYRDAAASGKATVMKYFGGNWTVLGSAGFSAGTADHISLAFDQSWTPYVAYKDGANGGKATVMRYGGGFWTPVGGAGSTAGSVDYVSLATSAAGIYMCFSDGNNSNKLTVMRFNGSAWVSLGTGISTGSILFTKLVANSSGDLWVAFRDQGDGNKTVVKKYTSATGWETLGGSAVSPSEGDYPTMTISSAGVPYVAYADNNQGWKATVKKYNGTSWQTIGSEGFSAGIAVNPALVVDGSGIPMLAYKDAGTSNKLTVARFLFATIGASSTSSAITQGNSTGLSATGGTSYTWAPASSLNTSVGTNVAASPTTTTTYTVTGTNSLSCTGTATVTVTVVEPITGTATLCVGTTTTLNNTTAGGTWQSGSTARATVSSSGVVTGQSAGMAVISYIAMGLTVTRVVTINAGYSVTATAGSNGSISPSGSTAICSGGTQVYTITPATNYHIDAVTVDGSSIGAVSTYTFAAVSASHTVNATFAPDCVAPANASAPTINSVLCNGGSTGSVVPNVSGTAPFTWTWNTGATTSTLTSIPAGVYTYTVSNACGSTTGAATVTEPAALSASNTATNALCFGGHTGSASVTATGGTAPYSGTGNMTGLTAGTHYFMVADANGCATVTEATISQPAAALNVSSTATNVLCFGGSTGSVSVTATGGTSPYTNTGNFTGISAGIFNYTVTDANGCTATTSGFISQPSSALTILKTVTPVGCYGDATGSVLIDAFGGTPSYTGTGTFSGKTAGVYSFTVTDANGCTTSTTANVTQPFAPLSASHTKTDVHCYGGHNGYVYVSASGGTSPYFTAVGPHDGLTAGTYSFVVTDGNGCADTTTATLSQPTELVASKAVTNVRCYGEENGSVTISATGGITPYFGATTHAHLGPGTYYYTVSDGHGCETEVTATVTEPDVLTVTGTAATFASGFNLLCNNNSNGSVNVTATGGTAPYSNVYDHTGLSAGAYNFVVTDAHGCMDSTSGTLTQPDPFYIDANTSDDTICNGSSVSLSGTGGAGSFTWYANNGISTTTSSSPVTATPSTGAPTLTVGYRAIGYNSFGCPSMPDTVNVTVLPVGYFSGPSAVCSEYSVDLDNGTPGGTWYTPDTAYISLDQNGLVSAYAEFAGSTYPRNTTVSYTMPNGCTRTKVQTVNMTPRPIVGIATVCPASGLSLPAGIPSGGTWASSNANMTITMAGNGVATVNGISLGNAYISYIMPTGCYTYKNFTVAPMAAITGPTQVCTGNTIQLSHPLAGAQWSSNNPSMATINVSTGVVSGLSASTAVMSYKVNPTCYVTYTVTVSTTPANVTGPASVCKSTNVTLANATAGGTWMSDNTAAATVGSATGIVNGVDVGTANISYVMPTGCYKKITVTINTTPAAITGTNFVCVSRTSPYTIASAGGSWSSSSSVLTIDAATGVASGVAAGTANISYTLGAGCASYKAVTIAALPVAITGTTTVCEGGSTTLTSATPSLTWSSTDENVATIATASTTTGSVSGLLAGTSTISYTSPTGCTQTVTVTVQAAPASISGATNICAGAVSTYTNSVPGGTWGSSATSVASIGSTTGIATGIGAGTCTFTYTMPGNCKAFKTVTVDAQPAAITGTLSLCVGGTTTLTSTTPGQTWSSAGGAASVDASTGVVTGIGTGTTVIGYINAAGCARTATVNVSPSLPPIAGPAAICVGGTTTLTNSTTGGTWASSSAATGSIISASGLIAGVATGTTRITYRTNATCFITTTVTVMNAPAAITAPSTSVCQNATMLLTHATTGGTWSSSVPSKASIDINNGLVTGLTAGTTIISYIPTPGCVATYNITVNTTPNAITGTATVCDGSTTTLASTSAGGSWSSGSADIATAGTTGIVTGIDPGTATIMYMFLSTGCFVTRDVTVNPLPDAIVGDNALCAGLTDTFTNSTGGGSWASSLLTVANIGSATGILGAVGAGTATISYTLPTGCRTTKVFTAYALPATGITGTATVCEGATTTLTCTAAGHTWSSTNTSNATITPGSTTTAIVTGIAAGTTTISYTTAQGCARSLVVTVNMAPASIAGNNALCMGKVDTLTDMTPGGSWGSSVPGTATIGAATGYITAVATGTTNISYTLPNGCRKTAIVTVNALPGSISGAVALCGNNTTTLTSTTSGGTWSSSNIDVATAVTTTSTTATVTGGATAGTAAISYISAQGCSRAITVTVSAPVPAVTGPDGICVGAATTFSSGTGGTWSSANTAKGTTVSTTGVATGVAVGSTTLTYKVNATCYAVKNVTVNPAVAAITGTTNVCVGGSVVLACTTPGGTWTSAMPATADVVDTSGVVTGVATGTTLVTYQVTATGCFKTTSVNVLTTPAPIEGSLALTVGEVAVLYNSVSGGTWTSSTNFVATIGSTSGELTAVNVGSTIITYKLGNGCYRTASATVSNTLARSANGTTTQDVGTTSVRIFPNPSQGHITVETPVNGALVVYTIDGKQVVKYDVSTPATSVMLPYDLATGMYMCRFEGVDGSSTIVKLIYR